MLKKYWKKYKIISSIVQGGSKGEHGQRRK